jgi:PDZ domain-containing protein
MVIRGVPARVPAGRYLLTTVRADQFTVLQDLVEAFRPHREVVAASQIGSIAFQDDLFKESQVLAAVAAAREKGMDARLTGSGAEVTGVAAGSPAAGALKTGDLVVGVDGAAVHTEFDLQDAVQARPAGTTFSLTVRRGGSTTTVTIRSARITQGGRQTTAIGLLLVTRDIAVQSPFTITFTSRPIGGPSAGLAYALAISDALGNLEIGNRTVAATGAIDASGNVGDVGGVDLKAIGARARGARIFLVPGGEVEPARGLVDQVKGVDSLSEALSALRGLG